jgi:formimidoylglutamate deiminase
LKDAQKRFAISPNELVDMVLKLEEKTAGEQDANVAVGLHSLRAVQPSEIERVLAALPRRAIHIHVSEQPREVEECLAWCGRTPVAELQHKFGLNEKWNLVHATHITLEEIEFIASARATVTLCPATEGNLGDGFFPANEYFQRDGRFGIGTDSQITIDPREELRLFEYGRRLRSEKRVRSTDKKMVHSGAWLWLHAAEGGAHPSAAPVGKLQTGFRADFIVVNDQTPSMFQLTGDTLLDSFVFPSHGTSPVRDVWIGGKRVVADGKHAAEEKAARDFSRAVERWKSAA